MAGDFLQNITSSAANTFSDNDAVDIITFAEAVWGLDFEFLPVQKFLLKIFYGLELDKQDAYIPVPDVFNEEVLYTFTEYQFMEWLIQEGRINLKEYIPGTRFREFVLCVGRRGSKSSISSVIAGYEVYKLIKKQNPQAYYGFPEGQKIEMSCVATDKEQAGALFDMINSRIKNCNFLLDRIVKDASNTFDIQTDYDVAQYGSNGKSTIKVNALGCGSAGLRSKNNILVLLDEAAFFTDSNGKFSGDAVYKAITPSVASFTKKGTKTKGDGKIVVLSSPNNKSGLFWDIYNNAWNMPETNLMVQLYSSLMNPTIDSDFLKIEYKKNKKSFNCEYGAEFSDSSSNWVEDPIKFDECVNKKVTTSQIKGLTHGEYFMGIDLGLKNDSTAISIVHKEEDKYILDYSECWFSGSSDVWTLPNSIYHQSNKEWAGYDIIPIKEIAKKIEHLCQWFPIRRGSFDQWAAGYPLLEELETLGISNIFMDNYSAGVTRQMWERLKTLYEDQSLDLFNHPVLIKELKILENSQTGKNIKVQAPQRAGYHDDISDSYARAIQECLNANSNKVFKNACLPMGKSIKYNKTKYNNIHMNTNRNKMMNMQKW